MWRRDGTELFYVSTVNRRPAVIAVTGGGTSSFTVAARRVLFTIRDLVRSREPHANYDVAPDGETFVMIVR